MSDISASGNRICKRCLTRDMAGGRELFEKLRERIAGLDPRDRAGEALYEERLAVCGECEQLLQGTCRSCGCYVEYRAAAAGNSCPERKW